MSGVYYLNQRVIVKTGDITREKCSAIVNAANSSLLGGGGVDGAIHRAGGPAILDECRKIRENDFPQGLPPGLAVMTGGGNLPSPHVIHTVGPIWNGGHSREPEILADCYKNSLQIASDYKLESVAFPAISTGVYGYPLDKAAGVSSEAVKIFLSQYEFPRVVIFIFFSEPDKQVFILNQKF